MEFTKEELKTMKRTDLQKLCKKFGVKANMKTEKMVEALMNYSNKNENEEIMLPACNKVLNEEKETSNDQVAKGNENKQTNKQENKETNASSKRKSGSKTEKTVKASKIPRLNPKPDRKQVECKTPTSNTNGKNKTPKGYGPKNWSKIHQKQFDKMDSLDVYLSKKCKRAQELGSSAKTVKSLTEKVNITNKVNQTQDLKSSRSKSLAIPGPKQEITKQKRLTFNFCPSIKENATVTTPATAGKRPTTISTNEKAHKPATPFRFSSNSLPFGSPTPRKKFDLQASLSKPLKYKPYTGKLPTPPFTEHTAKKTSAHQKDVKAVKTKTVNERRQRQMKNQSRARESAVSKRRGLMG